MEQRPKHKTPFTALDCPYADIVEFAKCIGPRSIPKFCELIENTVKHPNRLCHMECTFRSYAVNIIAIQNWPDNTMLLIRDWNHAGSQFSNTNDWLFCRVLLDHERIEWMIAQVTAARLVGAAR